MHTPYTYLIGWSQLNKWYYGVRFGKNCHPSEFWVKYFTSSNRVKDMREKFGDPDIIQIRKTFDSAESAKKWETKVLVRCKVHKQEKWLNRYLNQGACGVTNSSWKPGHSTWNKGKTGVQVSWSKGLTKLTDDRLLKTSINVSIAQKKRMLDINNRPIGEKNGMFGKTHSEETKESARQRRIKYNKENPTSIGKRWYIFENGETLYTRDENHPKFSSGIKYKLGRKW